MEEYIFETHGKYTFRLDSKLDFFKWINQYYGNVNSFMALKPKDKEVIFLRWKWGLSDVANESLEITRQTIIHQLGDGTIEGNQEKEDEGFVYYRRIINEFEKKCREIKQSIGLIYETADPAMAKVMKQFDGSFGD